MGSRGVEQIRVDGCTPSDPARLASRTTRTTSDRRQAPAAEGWAEIPSRTLATASWEPRPRRCRARWRRGGATDGAWTVEVIDRWFGPDHREPPGRIERRVASVASDRLEVAMHHDDAPGSLADGRGDVLAGPRANIAGGEDRRDRWSRRGTGSAAFDVDAQDDFGVWSTDTTPSRRHGSVRPSLQLTAFFTSAPILASSPVVNSFSAKEVGHMAPSSRFALSLKPNVAYLVLNFCAPWKKQTTLPSFAYAGIPYQVLGERAGALALMMAWSRSAMARSRAGISAIFASTSLSPSALPARGPRRAAAFSSWARSLIAARSSSVNPLDALPVVLLADCCLPVFAGFLSAIAKLLRAMNESQSLNLTRAPRATTRAFRREGVVFGSEVEHELACLAVGPGRPAVAVFPGW